MVFVDFAGLSVFCGFQSTQVKRKTANRHVLFRVVRKIIVHRSDVS